MEGTVAFPHSFLGLFPVVVEVSGYQAVVWPKPHTCKHSPAGVRERVPTIARIDKSPVCSPRTKAVAHVLFIDVFIN